MKIKFTKMHGAGNDYVYINCFSQNIEDPKKLAKIISHRRFSIGADGLILICPSKKADAQMRMYNADGTESKMCGNGLRCVAKFIADHILDDKRDYIKIESHGSVYTAQLNYSIDKKSITGATINMGKPQFKSGEIPSTIKENEIINHSLNVLDKKFNITCVNMGNPHTIIYVDNIEAFDLNKYGPKIETSKYFPEKTNVEFVQIISKNEVIQRTWERGSGETWACGSGASAVCGAGIKTGKTSSPLLVHLLGGDLEITWDSEGDLFLMGPAVEVFSGEIDI